MRRTLFAVCATCATCATIALAVRPLGAQRRGCAAGVHKLPPPPGAYLPCAVDREPTLRTTPLPRYPAMLQSARIGGTVLLRFAVDSLGRVDTTSVRVLRSSHALFTSAAVRAVGAWRGTPGRRAGRPVAVVEQYAFDFSLACASGRSAYERGHAIVICGR